MIEGKERVKIVDVDLSEWGLMRNTDLPILKRGDFTASK